MNRIGSRLLKETKAALADDKSSKSSRRKDILSLLAQANSAEAETQQMTDEEVMARAYRTIFLDLVYLLNMLFRDSHFHYRWS
jgi:cytochrome P450